MESGFEVSELQHATTAEIRSLRELMSELSARPLHLDEAIVGRVLGHPGNTVFVVRDRMGDLVGMLTLQVLPTLSGEHARIEDVVVLERARGHGLGRRLLQAALKSARQRGVIQIDLTSRPERREANGLYLRMGFERRETNVYRYRVDDVHRGG